MSSYVSVDWDADSLNLQGLFLSDKILRLVVDDDVKRWILWFLRSPVGRKQIETLATGNQHSMRNITQDALRSIKHPLPPIAEQQRIEAKINSLSAKSRRGCEHLDHVPRLVEKYKAGDLGGSVSWGVDANPSR
jgi:type I restriction enzyme S subunit